MGNDKFCSFGTVRPKQDQSKGGLSVTIEINGSEAGTTGAMLTLKQLLVVLIQIGHTDNVRVGIFAGNDGAEAVRQGAGTLRLGSGHLSSEDSENGTQDEFSSHGQSVAHSEAKEQERVNRSVTDVTSPLHSEPRPLGLTDGQ